MPTPAYIAAMKEPRTLAVTREEMVWLAQTLERMHMAAGGPYAGSGALRSVYTAIPTDCKSTTYNEG